MNYSTNISFQSVEVIKKLQEQKLQETLLYIQHNSPFYSKLFTENKIKIEEIKTLEDLKELPITTKKDLQLFNWDFLCVPKEKIIEYTTTSGTLGSPVIIALTENDLDRLALNEYGSFVCADGTAHDIYQLQLTLDRQFMAGIAYYSGLRKLGAGIIRLGSVHPLMQWENIQRLHPTILISVPSMILKLIEYAQQNIIDLNNSSVKKAICIGENIRLPDFSFNALGNKIQNAWKIQLYSTYASTEMQTGFTECKEGKGGHHQPELIIVEILDDEGNIVPDGLPGEVTITTLGLEGMPLLRYRTGDLCIRHSESCACGRNSMRLSPVLGRKQQMIKLKGTTLYPSSLFELLNRMTEIKEYVVEVFTNELGTDEVILHIEPIKITNELTLKIRNDLQSRIRVLPQIKYVTNEEILLMQFPEGSRKSQRFKDSRSNT